MVKNYIAWLCNRVTLDKTKYSRLASLLFATSFDWPGRIPLDANRANDGLQLRYEYYDETGDNIDDILSDCSVLEMMVALAERMDGIMGEPGESQYGEWFAEMLKNLGLDKQTNRYFDANEVERILENMMYRDIKYSGKGGLFPLRNAVEDQRYLSLWDQMSCYINEKF